MPEHVERAIEFFCIRLCSIDLKFFRVSQPDREGILFHVNSANFEIPARGTVGIKKNSCETCNGILYQIFANLSADRKSIEAYAECGISALLPFNNVDKLFNELNLLTKTKCCHCII